MTTTSQSNGHVTTDQNRQLRALNERYRPMLSASNQALHAADSARKQVEASYMRERQEILSNGHDAPPSRQEDHDVPSD
jgi:hypothetical protein